MASTSLRLRDFPPEILRDILNGPHRSWAVLELWKAGDRTLNAKLVNYGVTDIDLRDQRADSTSRWPRCVTEFKLERLSIVRSTGPFYPVDALRKELQHLHSGLKILTLYVPGVLEAVLPPMEPRTDNFQYDPDVGSDSSGDDKHPAYLIDQDSGDDNNREEVHIDQKEKEDDDNGSDDDENGSDDPSRYKHAKTLDGSASNEPHQSLWDLGRTWPTLQHLELAPFEERNLFCSEATMEYGARALALLPRSLTWIELHSSAIKVLPALLPPGLTTLRLRAQSLMAKDLHILPQNITDLHLSVCGEGLELLSSNHTLLPALKAYPWIDFDDITFYLGALRRKFHDREMTWPEYMLEMNWYMDELESDEHHNWFDDHRLPKSLTSLTSSVRFYGSPTLSPASIVNLPRGLVILNLYRMEWHDVDESKFSHWPSTLTALSVSLGDFNLEAFHLLPRTLKSLIIGAEIEEYIEYDESAINSDFEALCKLGRESIAADGQWPSIKREILRCVCLRPRLKRWRSTLN